MLCILNVSFLWSGNHLEDLKQRLAFHEKEYIAQQQKSKKQEEKIKKLEQKRIRLSYLKEECNKSNDIHSNECEKLEQFFLEYSVKESPE